MSIATSIALPTVEQCRTFLDLVNRGREACGLEPLEKLDFDDATPGDVNNCLSARNLFKPAKARYVGTSTVDLDSPFNPLIGALSLAPMTASQIVYRIPAEILAVTDAFDNVVMGLRKRLVEAGVV
jgi:hypothetical protein